MYIRRRAALDSASCVPEPIAHSGITGFPSHSSRHRGSDPPNRSKAHQSNRASRDSSSKAPLLHLNSGVGFKFNSYRHDPYQQKYAQRDQAVVLQRSNLFIQEVCAEPLIISNRPSGCLSEICPRFPWSWAPRALIDHGNPIREFKANLAESGVQGRSCKNLTYNL